MRKSINTNKQIYGLLLLVALLKLSSDCHGPVSILCLFLTVLYIGLQCVIVLFPDHTHLLSVPCRYAAFQFLSIIDIFPSCNVDNNLQYLTILCPNIIIDDAESKCFWLDSDQLVSSVGQNVLCF